MSNKPHALIVTGAYLNLHCDAPDSGSDPAVKKIRDQLNFILGNWNEQQQHLPQVFEALSGIANERNDGILLSCAQVIYACLQDQQLSC